MDKLQAVKGMNDLLPPEINKWQYVERMARETFEAYGYREVRTPIVEYTPLFVRGIGEATDIVEKEMYTFADKDGAQLTMRPEGTASLVRALVEHGVLGQDPIVRWYCAGPMFRRERAQKGRYRQFYQMDCEVFGVAEPTIDAEIIAMLWGLFGKLGIAGLELRINCVGGPDDRPAYRAALVEYFSKFKNELCPDCQRRLESNPLRILDCKVPRCAEIAAGAPSILDHLGAASRGSFEGVAAALDLLGVPYQKDPRMVRGLDYYTGTVFEIRGLGGELGAQNAICGGGRYDNLVAELGGPPTPAVGFAFGLERLVMCVPGAPETFDPGIDIFLMQMGARDWALKEAHRLRGRGVRVELSHKQASFKSQMKRADRLRAKYVLIVGADELAQGAVKLRDMASGEERMVPQATLDDELKKLGVFKS